MLDDVERRYPARHYVMVDDKLRILAAMKKSWGEKLTTVFPRQGHYALDEEANSKFPAADHTIERIGDKAWRDLLLAHNAAMREQIAHHRAREFDISGDGFMAMFDGAVRAVRCGLGMIRAASRLGLQVRVGCHTGEVVLVSGYAHGLPCTPPRGLSRLRPRISFMCRARRGTCSAAVVSTLSLPARSS